MLELLQANSNPIIPMADSPLCYYPKIEHVKLSDFRKSVDFTFSENMFIDESIHDELLQAVNVASLHPDYAQHQEETAYLHEQFAQLLENPAEHITLVKSKDRGLYAVVSSGKMIKRGQLVSHYAGEYVLHRTRKNIDDSHSIACPAHLHPMFMPFKNLYISGKFYGGITRYIHHAPNHAELADQFEFDEGLANSVALSNLKRIWIFYKNTLCCCFVAARDIHEHEILTFSYGDSFWAWQKFCPDLYTLYGEVIPEKYYRRKHVSISLKAHRRFYLYNNSLDFFMGHILGQVPLIIPTDNKPLKISPSRLSALLIEKGIKHPALKLTHWQRLKNLVMP